MGKWVCSKHGEAFEIGAPCGYCEGQRIEAKAKAADPMVLDKPLLAAVKRVPDDGSVPFDRNERAWETMIPRAVGEPVLEWAKRAGVDLSMWGGDKWPYGTPASKPLNAPGIDFHPVVDPSSRVFHDHVQAFIDATGVPPEAVSRAGGFTTRMARWCMPPSRRVATSIAQAVSAFEPMAKAHDIELRSHSDRYGPKWSFMLHGVWRPIESWRETFENAACAPALDSVRRFPGETMAEWRARPDVAKRLAEWFFPFGPRNAPPSNSSRIDPGRREARKEPIAVGPDAIASHLRGIDETFHKAHEVAARDMERAYRRLDSALREMEWKEPAEPYAGLKAWMPSAPASKRESFFGIDYGTEPSRTHWTVSSNPVDYRDRDEALAFADKVRAARWWETLPPVPRLEFDAPPVIEDPECPPGFAYAVETPWMRLDDVNRSFRWELKASAPSMLLKIKLPEDG